MAETKQPAPAEPQSNWTDEPLPPSPRPYMWFFGGCGVLLLIFVVCSAGVVLTTTKFGQDESRHYAEEAFLLIQSSPTIIEYLGEPIEMDGPTGSTLSAPDDEEESSVAMAELLFAVKGPKGAGKVRVGGTLQGKEYRRGRTTLEIDDQIIEVDLDGELLPEIELDFGTDF